MLNPDLEAFFATRGTQIAVSKALGVTKQSVNEWRKKGFVPSDRANDFEQFTGVPREKACPDFPWAKPKRAKQQKAEA
jgi:DNA-binding transcriptional regulator YdaS (Cro superfamily)